MFLAQTRVLQIAAASTARRTVDALWDAIGIALDDFPHKNASTNFAMPDMGLPNREAL